MAQFTQAAIRQAFLQLLASTPLDKITVRSIVDACGISRNTFYYHYEDIPALLQDVLRVQLEEAAGAGNPAQRQRICRVLAYVAKNRKLFQRVYRSGYWPQLEAAFLRSVEQAVESTMALWGGDQLREEERRAIIIFFSGGIMRLSLQWLRNSHQEAEDALMRRSELFEALLEEAVRRAASGSV